jgi:hypothetical protein
VIERAGAEPSEGAEGAGGRELPESVAPETHDEIRSEQRCANGVGCFDVICSASLNVEEEELVRIHLADLCGDGTGLTSAIFLKGDRLASIAAAGAELSLHARRFDGARTLELELLGYAGESALGAIVVRVEVADTIQQPSLVVGESVRRDGFEYRTYYSAGPDGQVDERYPVLVSIPDTGVSLPVELFLHGFYGEPRFSIEPEHVTIMPSDPDNTYWWGERVGNAAEPTTQWRVVDALTELLVEIPQADADRVVISGASMGGAGAAAIGFTYPELFAGILATDGQAVPRNHRPRRIAQLTTLWGPPGPVDPANPVAGWDTTDLTWLLQEHDAAREIPVFTRYGRDDTIIHFGALVDPSPLTGNSWLTSMQGMRVPWVLGWDEGGHVAVSDGLERDWWTAGWNPLTDPMSYVDRTIPAIGSRAARRDGNPGDGTGNGRRVRDENSAYAGDPAVPGDDGWAGDTQGIIGGWVSWDTAAIVERPETLQLRVRLASIVDVAHETVDIVVRRTRIFRPGPGDAVTWSLGGANSGLAELSEDGAITLVGLPLSHDWQVLELRWNRSL